MSIILDHVNYVYSKGTNDEIKALDDVSFEIRDGDFLGLIGHTGSGKSTLIKHLNCILKPTCGEIYIDGVDVWKDKAALSKIRQNVGLVLTSNIIYVSSRDTKDKVFLDTDCALDASANICLAKEKSLPSIDSKEVISLVRDALKSIFVLNPDPQAMRRYSKLSKELRMDAGNIAGVIAALNPEEKDKLEEKLTKYVKPLPERDINKITAVTVGLSASDAMLYCYEDWNPKTPVR